MRVLDLFSGIGGFSIGLESIGMETVAFCEQNPFCQKILAQHWPTLPIHSDITELNGYEYRGSVDLVCGGFPCQPFSVAGKQLGAEDDRALWPEMLRVIREVAPRWVIGENVSGIIPMELDNVLSDLEGEGYTCWTFVLPACAVDAHHRRDRVWVVAHSSSDVWRNTQSSFGRSDNEAERSQDTDKTSRPSKDVADATGAGLASGKPSRVGANEKKNKARLGFQSERRGVEVADTARQRQQESGTLGDAIGEKTKRKREATKPFDGSQPCLWEPEPNVGRVANGVPNRVDRLKQLGNAVVPQIPELIGRAICQAG